MLPAAYGSFWCFSRLQKTWVATSYLLSLPPSLEMFMAPIICSPATQLERLAKKSSWVSNLSHLHHRGHQHNFLDFVLCQCVVSDSS